MIDAMGWEILRNDSFGKDFAPTRKRLESVFGYSSTCVPSILSGNWPVEHRNWCYFVHDPENSPFRSLRLFRWLPKAITSRRIVRRLLTKLVRKQLDFRGYFDLYNIPFRNIHTYDFTEKKSPLQPGGMNRGTNIFDYLTQTETPYFVSDPAQSEEQNRDDLLRQLNDGEIDFAFMYWPGLDGLLHRVGNDSPEIPQKLRVYEQWIQQLLAAAGQNYEEVKLYVFSDHGMANCDVHLDLMSRIEALPIAVEKDYAVVYDSTMARFWFFNDRARELITRELNQVKEGRIIPDAELDQMRTLFPDRYFGELIFLVQEGVLIVPSHMGERPIRAMHGYHPSDPHSYATLLTNQPEIPANITAIPHICNLMKGSVDQAKQLNSIPTESVTV
jgi:predicted AlkP superfamily pyrophosphatase or phosphodiesterase